MPSTSSSATISALNDGLKVLSPQSEHSIRDMKNIANSLKTATHHHNNNHTTNTVPNREDVKKSTIRYNFDCDDVCIDTLRVVGEELGNMIQGLEASIEQHFVGFFSHVKLRHEKELSLWVRGGAVPLYQQQSFGSMTNNNNNINQNTSSSSSLLTQISSSLAGDKIGNNKPSSFANAMIDNPSSVKPVLAVPDSVQRDISMFALQSWLLLELESLVSQMNVTRAAVYLKGLDNSDFLKLAAAVPKTNTHYFSNGNLTTTGDNSNSSSSIPKEISAASHSILTTVVNTGVGASITKSANSPTPRGEIPFTQLMCLPLFAGKSKSNQASSYDSNDDDLSSSPHHNNNNNNNNNGGVIGCVVVTDKIAAGLNFDTVDELRLWGFAQSACGVLQRYSPEWFIPPLTIAGARHNHAPPDRRPKVGSVDHLQEQIWTTLDAAASLPRIGASNNNTNSHHNNNSYQHNNNSGNYNSSDMSQMEPVHAFGVGHGRRKIGGASSSSITATTRNQASTTTTSNKNHQKIPFIRTGTVMEAAKNKQRISQIAGSSNFTSQKSLLLDDDTHQNNANSSSSTSFTKNSKGNSGGDLIATELSHEEVVESVAPYLRNLEGLWRKALDESARMKNECTNWRAQVDIKDARIIELEVALRHLNRQMSALQADVELIRNAVPEGLALANIGRDVDKAQADEEQKELERKELLRKTFEEMY